MIVALSMISLVANAQLIGCVSDDTGNLYTSPIYGTTYNVTPKIDDGNWSFDRKKCKQNTGICRMRVTSQCSGCGPKQPDGYWYQSGQEYFYVPCPIDDYIGLMLVAIGGLGFILIRKNVLFT